MAIVRTTWTDGSTVVNNARLQAIYQAIDDEVRASAYNSAVQSINNTTWTALTFNSEDYDTGSMHSTSSNTSRITVPSSHAGLYVMTGTVAFDSNATGFRAVSFYKNGAILYTPAQTQPITGSLTVVNVTAWAVLAVADYIELFAYQSSGGALNTGSATSATANRLQVTKVR